MAIKLCESCQRPFGICDCFGRTDSPRLKALREKCVAIPYKKVCQRLSESEFDQIVEFIEDHDDLDHLSFEYAVNRMFLDRAKPRNFAIIMEMLLVSNTAAHGRSKEK